MGTPFAALGSQSVTFAKAYRAEELRGSRRPARGTRRPRRRRRLPSFTRTTAYAPHHPSLQREA